MQRQTTPPVPIGALMSPLVRAPLKQPTHRPLSQPHSSLRNGARSQRHVARAGQRIDLSPNEMDAIVCALHARTREVLDEWCPAEGIVFPKFAWRYPFRTAALAAGLEPDRASQVKPYDLRTALRRSSRNVQGTFSVPATCLDIVMRRPPISTFMRAVERQSPFFRDRIWDRLKVVSRYP